MPRQQNNAECIKVDGNYMVYSSQLGRMMKVRSQDMIARTRSKAVVKYTILAALTLTGAMLKRPRITLLLL